MKSTRSHIFVILTLALAILILGGSGLAQAQDPTPPTTDNPVAEPQAPATALGAAASTPLSTSFTYQGRLNDGGNPANDAYDFQFKLFDAASGGAQIGSTQNKDNLAVSGGLFTTDLDFGAGAFDGQARWLELAVRPGASTSAHATLAPRRALLASPYALYSTVTRGLNVTGGGNVGIGTTAPEGQLDVVGNVISRGSSAQLTVRNPGNQRAAMHFNWLNNVARIRISGEGTGAYNGIDIQGVGDVSLLRVSGEGKVGIGTTAPEGQLDVIGDVISRGSKAGLTVRNPGNQQAVMQFNWIDNIARIRIGGGGTGAYNGIDIQGVGDVSLLRVTGNGTTSTNVLQIRGGADLAEPFAIAGQPEPGMVVAIDPDHFGQLRIADKAYDHTVAGVISGAGGLQPGLTMQQPEVVQGETHPVALTGRVYVRADASSGAIQPGDLLTTSATPGHAMKAADYDQAQGAILGKAMSRLEAGKGLVLVLVSLQ